MAQQQQAMEDDVICTDTTNISTNSGASTSVHPITIYFTKRLINPDAQINGSWYFLPTLITDLLLLSNNNNDTSAASASVTSASSKIFGANNKTLPPLEIFKMQGKWCTLDNGLLYLYKRLSTSADILLANTRTTKIPVRLVELPPHQRSIILDLYSDCELALDDELTETAHAFPCKICSRKFSDFAEYAQHKKVYGHYTLQEAQLSDSKAVSSPISSATASKLNRIIDGKTNNNLSSQLNKKKKQHLSQVGSASFIRRNLTEASNAYDENSGSNNDEEREESIDLTVPTNSFQYLINPSTSYTNKSNSSLAKKANRAATALPMANKKNMTKSSATYTAKVLASSPLGGNGGLDSVTQDEINFEAADQALNSALYLSQATSAAQNTLRCNIPKSSTFKPQASSRSPSPAKPLKLTFNLINHEIETEEDLLETINRKQEMKDFELYQQEVLNGKNKSEGEQSSDENEMGQADYDEFLAKEQQQQSENTLEVTLEEESLVNVSFNSDTFANEAVNVRQEDVISDMPSMNDEGTAQHEVQPFRYSSLMKDEEDAATR